MHSVQFSKFMESHGMSYWVDGLIIYVNTQDLDLRNSARLFAHAQGDSSIFVMVDNVLGDRDDSDEVLVELCELAQVEGLEEICFEVD